MKGLYVMGLIIKQVYRGYTGVRVQESNEGEGVRFRVSTGS